MKQCSTVWFCLLRYTGTHAVPVVKHTALALDEAVSESISEPQTSTRQVFYRLPKSFGTLGSCRNTCSSCRFLHWTSETASKIQPQHQYWTLEKLQSGAGLWLSSRAVRWWLSMGQILGHRNQIKNGKWNRGCKPTCYLCKLGLHLLIGNEEEGGKTVLPLVQQQAE